MRRVLVAAPAALLLSLAAVGFALEPVGEGSPGADEAPSEVPDPELDSLREERFRLARELRATVPRSVYLVVDRGNNRLWVRDRSGIVHDAPVSTGSGAILRESGGQGRSWTFDTPAGRFRVLGERRNPVWVKPDWAFLEEGLPLPTRRSQRVEEGTLGEWALDLGDGYMIHGTLYERLIGRSLTHGCIRVGREDLRIVARAAAPGTPVYIF